MLTRTLHCTCQKMVQYMQYNCSLIPPPQVERFGKPTWRRLVEAVENRVGGNNRALALKIAAEHPGSNTTSFH